MTSSTRSKTGPLPPTYFLVAIVAMVAVDLLVPMGGTLSWPWRLGGLVPLAAGLGLTIAANQQFERVGTAVRPFEPSSVFVTNGAFRVSRNPMYLGMILVLLGLGLGLGNATPFVVVPVFVCLLTVRFVVPEERAMAEQFGDAYEAYRRRVRRWL